MSPIIWRLEGIDVFSCLDHVKWQLPVLNLIEKEVSELAHIVYLIRVRRHKYFLWINHGPYTQRKAIVKLTDSIEEICIEGSRLYQREAKERQIFRVHMLICMEMQPPISREIERYTACSEKDTKAFRRERQK